MAEFSKEYSLINGIENYDFSYLETFTQMKEGEVYNEICEGFGSIGLLKKDNAPFLIFKIKDEIQLKEAYSFISSFEIS